MIIYEVIYIAKFDILRTAVTGIIAGGSWNYVGDAVCGTARLEE